MAKVKPPASIAALLSGLDLSSEQAARLLTRIIEFSEEFPDLKGLPDKFIKLLGRGDKVALEAARQSGDFVKFEARLANALETKKVEQAGRVEIAGITRETRERVESIKALERSELETQRETARTARAERAPKLAGRRILEEKKATLRATGLEERVTARKLEPFAASVRTQLADINVELNKSAPIEANRLQERLTKLGEATKTLPEVEAERALAETRLLSRRDRAATETRARISKLLGAHPEAGAVEFAVAEAEARAHPIDVRTRTGKHPTVRDRRIIEQAQAMHTTERLAVREAPAAGLRVRGGAIPTTGAADFLVREKPSMFGGKALTGAATNLQELVQEAKRTGVAAESGGIRGILQKAKGAPGKTKALGAAVGIPLLLMSLFKGKDTQQMNPMMQIRLLQQMAEQQQAGRLNETKSMSQEANAQQAMARAALLRAQLMQVMGGGLQSSVF